MTALTHGIGSKSEQHGCEHRGNGVPWARARARAHTAAQPIDTQIVALTDATGTTLAQELRSRSPLPAFDTAAMDGYAVSGPGPHQVIGRLSPGSCWPSILRPGEALAISTGAAVPAGASAVLPLEQALLDGARLTGPDLPADRHIRRTGEDVAAGTLLLARGSRVRAATLGLAAACGYDTLIVRPRPRVRIVITGDELSHAGVSADGRIRDALGPALPALVDSLGGEVVDLRRLDDHPEGRLAAFLQPGTEIGEPDVTVVTGSTSVGTGDQLRRLLDATAANWVVDTVACRPGHPQILAGLGHNRWVVGLPGNPYAAFVAAYTLLAPLLIGLGGGTLPGLPTTVVHGDIQAAPAVTRILPVVRCGGGVHLLPGHGSAFLHGAAMADALVAIRPGWEPGQPAPFLAIN
jgi:molybdopterin molybdotransferase